MPPDRRTAAIAWAEQVLGPHRLHPLKLRPWAATWRAERPGRPDLFLKSSTPATGHEAALLTVLSRVTPDLVPELVAADPPQHRLIVASAGTVLRELSRSSTFDQEARIPLVAKFAQLQLRVMPYVDEILAQGIPDVRPERYPEMLRAFTLARQLPDAERERLQDLADTWDRNGTGLPASLIPLSIQHGDLHDNNVAVDTAGVRRFFDFGDSTVAHPFSTMDLPLLFAKEDGVDPAPLEDAYLAEFSDFAPLEDLRRELHAVVSLAPLQRAHNWARALRNGELSWDPAAAAEWNQPIEYWLGRLGRVDL